MKSIILAGGAGSRLFEETRIKPKPLVNILNKPIILLIILYLKKYDVDEIFICLGYKGKLIEKYFFDYVKKNRLKFEFNEKKKVLFIKSGKLKNIKINFCKTGLNSGTGGRLLKIKNKFEKDDNFFMVYGDGVADLNLKKLRKFHLKNNKIATMTIVKPKNRFGLAFCKGNKLISFNEKKRNEKDTKNWINAGIFCLNYKIFSYIKNSRTFFEHEPIQKLIKKKQINVYKHTGYWACMDTLKDKLEIEKQWRAKHEWTNLFR